MVPHLPHAPKSLRIALYVVHHLENGEPIGRAVNHVANGLEISPGAVASCVLRWRQRVELSPSDYRFLMEA